MAGTKCEVPVYVCALSFLPFDLFVKKTQQGGCACGAICFMLIDHINILFTVTATTWIFQHVPFRSIRNVPLYSICYGSIEVKTMHLELPVDNPTM